MTTNAIPMAKEKVQRIPRHIGLPAFLPVGMAAVSLVSLLVLVQTTGITTTGYDVRRLEQERDGWQQASYQLESEVARLQGLERIEKEAKGKLQMVPATDYIFIKVQAVPSSGSEVLSPPSHVRRTDFRREDEGWSQRLLDWLGAALGFRQK